MNKRTILLPEDILNSLYSAPVTQMLCADLPDIPQERAKFVTYVGYTFNKNNTIATKIYYSPHVHDESMQDIPPKQKQLFSQHNRALLSCGCRLYDFSIQRSHLNEQYIRALWHLPVSSRTSRESLTGIINHAMNTFGLSAECASVIYDINDTIKNGLGTKLEPLYLLGGYITDDKDSSIVKLDFDADIVTSADFGTHQRKTHFDNHLAIRTTEMMMKNILHLGNAQDIVKQLNTIVQNGYNLVFWGTHLTKTNLNEIKLYLQAENSLSLESLPILKELFDMIHPHLYADYVALAEHYHNCGWDYYGFNLSLLESGFGSPRLYMFLKNSVSN